MTRALRHEWHSLLYDPESDLSIAAKVVGCALIEHANREGIAWPGLPELGAYAGVSSRTTVLKGVRELERAGLLEVTRRAGRVHRYRLVIPTRTTRSDSGRVPVHEPVHRPVHEMNPNQGTREPVRPTVVADDAQTIVAHYVNLQHDAGAPTPRRLVGLVAKEVGDLLGEGIPPRIVRRAVELLVERPQLGPSVLPTLIPEAARGPGRRAQPEHEVDARVREAFAETGDVLVFTRSRQRDRLELGEGAP